MQVVGADVGFGCTWEGGLWMLLHRVGGGIKVRGAEVGCSCSMLVWGAGCRCGVQGDAGVGRGMWRQLQSVDAGQRMQVQVQDAGGGCRQVQDADRCRMQV